MYIFEGKRVGHDELHQKTFVAVIINLVGTTGRREGCLWSMTGDLCRDLQHVSVNVFVIIQEMVATKQNGISIRFCSLLH